MNTPSITQMDGFDRLTLWFDRSELPVSKSLLSAHCARIVLQAAQPKYHCNRKLKLSVFQPTAKFLQILLRGVDREVGVEIAYAEVARDIVLSDPHENEYLQAAFLASAQVVRLRQRVVFSGNTAYYGRRPPQERGHVLVLYADKPSKLNNARPHASAQRCVHVEWRASGKAALAAIGIASLEDVLNFDYDHHWNDCLKLHNLPSKTALGKKLAALCAGKANASEPAYLKRANQWLTKYTLNEQFVLQNALRDMPELARRLKRYTWNEWLDAYT